MVPDFRRDDVWMPPYQERGRLIKSGMTDQAVYGQTLIIYFLRIDLRIYLKEGVSIGPVDAGESEGIRGSVDSQFLHDVHAGR
jgi:hypothetical protein